MIKDFSIEIFNSEECNDNRNTHTTQYEKETMHEIVRNSDKARMLKLFNDNTNNDIVLRLIANYN